jgi:hypothetical protein
MSKKHFDELQSKLPSGNWIRDDGLTPDGLNELICNCLRKGQITENDFMTLVNVNYSKTPDDYYPKDGDKTWKKSLEYSRGKRSPGKFCLDVFNGVCNETYWFNRLVNEVIKVHHPEVKHKNSNSYYPYFDRSKVEKNRDFTLIFGKRTIPVDTKACPTHDFFTPKEEDLRACCRQNMYILGFWVPRYTEDSKKVKYGFISPKVCKAILDAEEAKIWHSTKGYVLNDGKPSIRLWANNGTENPKFEKYFQQGTWDCDKFDIPE